MHNVKTQFESKTHKAKAPCFGGQFGLGPLQGGKGFADQLFQKIFLAIVDIVQKRGEHLAGVASYDTSTISCYIYLLGA